MQERSYKIVDWGGKGVRGAGNLLVDICFEIYVANGQNKQNLADLQFPLKHALFSNNWCRKLRKKNLEYESILYNYAELSVD